jgi:3-methyladenine DNA glycosylase AlkD
MIHEINHIINDLKLLSSPEKAQHLQRFFKTGVGQYAEGDIFWGITVPLVRRTASVHKNMTAVQLDKLLEHKVHEVRLCALLIMVFQSRTSPDQMYDLYLKKTNFINNWDLVDLSAPIIVGNFLLNKDCYILYKLAQSNILWERRIAIIATFAFIKQGHTEHTLKIAQVLMNDKHDLINKAVGWMLREIGKRCSVDILGKFLEKHAATMPRTTLRYAIEHMSDEKRKYFMQAKAYLVHHKSNER